VTCGVPAPYQRLGESEVDEPVPIRGRHDKPDGAVVVEDRGGVERAPAEGPANSLQRVQAFDRTRWVVDRGRQRADNHVDDAPNRERRILEQAAAVREEQPAPGLALIDQAPAPDD